MSFLAALIAFLKGIPALAGLGNKLAEMFGEYDRRGRIADAAARKASKDAAVDARIDAALGVPGSTGQPGQRANSDGPAGLPASGAGGTGVDAGRAQNDKPVGAGD